MNAQLALGAPLKDAIVSAALKRVRPILMTASVTILGLVPLATGWGTGAELQQPLAVAVIGGILISTLMTLLVLPAGAILLLGRGKHRLSHGLHTNGAGKRPHHQNSPDLRPEL
jgi:Cu/Ag efflux pump CusA